MQTNYQQSRNNHATLRALMIESLANATVSTMPAVQQTSSTLVALTKSPTELTRGAQVSQTGVKVDNVTNGTKQATDHLQ